MLKVIAIIILVILSLRILARFFLPILGKYAIKKVNDKMTEQHATKTRGNKVYEKGDVEIRKPKEGINQAGEDDDFIEFDEVKD